MCDASAWTAWRACFLVPRPFSSRSLSAFALGTLYTASFLELRYPNSGSVPSSACSLVRVPPLPLPSLFLSLPHSLPASLPSSLPPYLSPSSWNFWSTTFLRVPALPPIENLFPSVVSCLPTSLRSPFPLQPWAVVAGAPPVPKQAS